MSSQVPLIVAEHVSKKFCRDLKRSLWYGVKDLCAEMLGSSGKSRGELRNLEFFAVNDVSFEVQPGECLGLIGPNGAGKSTFLKMLNGLIRPDSGRITMRGRVSALIELQAGFNPILTGRENIYVAGSVLGLSKKEIDRKLEQIIDFSELEDFIDTPVQSYSSGMRVRLGFAVASQLEPDVLLIDEVLAVGDVGFRVKCYEHILKLRKSGTSMILVSHNMVDIARVCDRCVVLDHGCVSFEGSMDDGINRYEELLGLQLSKTSGEGNGNVRLLEVFLASADGGKTQHFVTGDDVVLNLIIENNGPIIEDVRLMLHINSATVGNLARIASKRHGMHCRFDQGRNHIRCTLRHIPLLRGAYSCDLNIYGSNITKFILQRFNIARFYITSSDIDYFGFGRSGVLEVNDEWEQLHDFDRIDP